jgi:superoxide dismutase, Fe-Mn family
LGLQPPLRRQPHAGSRLGVGIICMWGRTAIQVAFTIFVLIETGLVPVQGRPVDRFGPKFVVLVGGMLVAIAWATNSAANTLCDVLYRRSDRRHQCRGGLRHQHRQCPQMVPFDPKTIKGLSEKLLVSHYENNYSGAVKRLNAIGSQLAELDFAKSPVFMINGLKREELIAMNSMILHEVYFGGLGGGGTPSGALATAIAHDFGSVDRWRTEFAAMGKAEGGGSGWVILAYSPRDKRLVNQWAADHTTTLAGGRPVLVLDMYEHASHMDYGAKAAAYVDAYMEAIRWENAATLYERYSHEA